MILVENRQLLFSNREEYLGTAYDAQSASRIFRIRRLNYDGIDLASLQFWVDMVYMDDGSADTQNLDVAVEDREILLTWTVSGITMAHKGTIKINLRARDHLGVVRWSSYQAVVYSEDTASPPQIPEGALSELEKIEADVQRQREALQEEEQSRKEAENKRKEAEEERKSAENARETAEETRQQGFDTKIHEFENTKSQLKGFAIEAESWAHGGTGIREGEETDNSRYYSEVARSEADRAKEQASLLEQYSLVVAPTFYYNYEDGCLYQSGGFNVEFYYSEQDGNLYMRFIKSESGQGTAGLPAGGQAGDVLTKRSDVSGDVQWAEDSLNMQELTEDELAKILEG